MRSFHKEGQYKYVCTLFAGMRGSVTVKPPPEEGTGAGANAAPLVAPGALQPPLARAAGAPA